MKKILGLAGMVLAATFATQALAEDFGRLPVSYQQSTASYVKSRISNESGATVECTGKPYRVYLDIRGQDDVPAWAVQVNVRSQANRRTSRQKTTVYIVNGQPVAVKDDRGVSARRV